MPQLFRYLAFALLALLLPLQAAAGACAQICALTAASQRAPASQVDAHHDMSGHEEHPGGKDLAFPDTGLPHQDCDKSDIGAGKCCQAHAYLAVPLATIPAQSAHAIERVEPEARWVSFIPEEPSPPPIGRAAAA